MNDLNKKESMREKSLRNYSKKNLSCNEPQKQNERDLLSVNYFQLKKLKSTKNQKFVEQTFLRKYKNGKKSTY